MQSSTKPSILKQNPLIMVGGKYGLAGAFVGMFAMLFLFWLNKNPMIYARYFDVILVPVFVFFAIREFKIYRNQGKLHFWQGMSLGFISYMLISILSGIFVLLLLYGLAPDLFTEYMSNRMALLAESKEEIISSIDANAYAQTLENLQNTKPWHLALDDFLKKSIIGLFLTILFSIILRK
ncbi:MAG: DUF4199 domain-containing protein [Cyclobacteriaceae bacterium]